MKNTIYFLMFFLFINLIGCGGPSGDPAQIGWQFYDDIMFDKFQDAYELLTSSDKENITFDEFKDFYTHFKDLLQINGIEAESLGAESDKNLYKIYKQAEMIKVNLDYISFIGTDSFNGEIIFSVVEEEGAWKVLFSSMFDFKPYYSTVLLNNALLYAADDPTSSFDQDLDKALKLCDKAIKVNPDNDQVYSQFMLIYREKKDYKKALEYGKKHYDVLKERQEIQEKRKYPNSDIVNNCITQRSNIAAMMGFILTEKGDKKAAKKYIEHAVELNPGNEKAVQLYNQLF